jgi:hypothetical protein
LSIFSFTLAPTAEAFWPTFDVIGAPSQVIGTILTAPSAVSNPVTAASNVGNFFLKTADHIKEFVLKPLAIAVARSIIRRMTVQTVNWINSGFKGNPMYVTNTGQFFMDQADTSASTLAGQLFTTFLILVTTVRIFLQIFSSARFFTADIK